MLPVLRGEVVLEEDGTCECGKKPKEECCKTKEQNETEVSACNAVHVL